MQLVACLLMLIGVEGGTADRWTGFRGDGSSHCNAKELPLTWSAKENIAWRVQTAGYGQSSPVVWKDKIFVAAVDGAEKETLILQAFDLKTGKNIWTKQFAATAKGKNNPMMSRAAGTPVVDANGVYNFFESGDVVALSHNGSVLWQRELTKDYGEFKNNHGLGTSLAQTEQAVFVLVDHAGPSYLAALDKKTGKTLWKTDRPSKTSWTSPTVAEQDGRPILLVSSSGNLVAYETTSGQELWTLEGLTGNNIPSPTVQQNFVVIGAGENRLKPDLAASSRSNCCIRLIMKNGKPAYETVWQGKKVVSHHASPLIHQGLVYIVNKVGLVHCLDLKTGEEKYAERLDNQNWATPIAAGEHLYFFGKDGVTTVLKSGPEFVVVARNRLWDDKEFAERREKAKAEAASKLPKFPMGKDGATPAPKKEGPPALPKEERESAMYSAVGDVVYAAAAVEGNILIRTGNELICIRTQK